MPDPDYTAFIRKHVTANGWRSAGQTGYFQHQETGAYFDAYAVAANEQGKLVPVWKLLSEKEIGPDPRKPELFDE